MANMNFSDISELLGILPRELMHIAREHPDIISIGRDGNAVFSDTNRLWHAARALRTTSLPIKRRL